MRIKTTLAVAGTVTMMALSIAACGGESTDGQATSDTAQATPMSSETESASSTETTAAGGADAEFDLCSTLSLDDVEPYIRSDLPIAARKSLKPDSYSDGGIANCEYGTYIKAGVTLSVPLSKRTPDLTALKNLTKKITSADEPTETTVGSDRAVTLTGDTDVAIAVAHEKFPILLRWSKLNDVPGETMTVEKLKELAELVTAKLPDSRKTLITIDLPQECDGIDAEPIIGKVAYARGSADVDNLQCDYAGENGTLTMDANALEPRLIESAINSARSLDPAAEITPPVSADTVVFTTPGNRNTGFKVDGKVSKGAEFTASYEAPRSETDGARSQDFDPAERTVITDYAAAAAAWVS